MTSYKVKENLDVYAPREAVGELATSLGFKQRERAELLIVVSELVTNIVKYGVRGAVKMEPHVDEVHGVGIAIVAEDEGPEFRDFKMAQRDGCDDQGPIDPGVMTSRNGLGIGLGAVKRMSDSLSLDQGPDGKAIRVVRYLQRPLRVSSLPPRGASVPPRRASLPPRAASAPRRR